MPYITTPMDPKFHQIAWDELLEGYVEPDKFEPIQNAPSSTRTVFLRQVSDKLLVKYDIPQMIVLLRTFNGKYADLIAAPKEDLYRTFYIPKSGIDPATGRPKMRRIDEPNPELKKAQKELRAILEDKMGALYHTSAFAYVKHRCVINAIQRHQANQSRWFLKLDFSDFFGSTTPTYLYETISNIFPFSEIVKYPSGAEELQKALSICFLRGGLPQGSPISPMLTNLMMIPIDHRLKNSLIKFTDGNTYVYTRYADDLLVSCKYKFDEQKVIAFIQDTLRSFRAPFALNEKKTRYGSRNGHNYNLGVILNANNEITVGYKQKREFRAVLVDYVATKSAGEQVDLHYVQQLMGQLNWYSSVEPNYWYAMLKRLNTKYNVDIMDWLLADLRA